MPASPRSSTAVTTGAVAEPAAPAADPAQAARDAPARGRRRRPALSEEVADHVRTQIMSGWLAAGDFVRLDRVAAELEVSATPVREGLQALAGEGFLALEPRRGFVVLPLTPDDVLDLFLAQAAIAGELAARAAVAATPEWLERLAGVQGALSRAAADGRADEVSDLNRTFHQMINRSARAPKLAWMLAVAVRFAPESLFALVPGWAQASVDDHEDVLAAMREGDPARAEEAMRAHVRHAGRLLAEHLRDRGAAPPGA